VWQSFLSISPHLSGGTMASSQTCCHLPGELLNSAAEYGGIYLRRSERDSVLIITAAPEVLRLPAEAATRFRL
jgi:hypothetical protein